MENNTNDNSCRYCGQVMILDDETLSGKEATEAATMMCDCSEGKQYREDREKAKWKKSRMQQVAEIIEEKFDDFDGDVTEVIEVIAEMVYDKEITKGVLQLNSITKASIKKVTSKGKDYVKIERTDRTTSSDEV